MSRRSSATRRRSYGRRLHEMNERRPRAGGRHDWLAELADGAAGSTSDQLPYRHWPAGGDVEEMPR